MSRINPADEIPLFSYSPLDRSDHEIRFLHLKPGKDSAQPIECYTSIARLDEKPQFEALSYMWGRPDIKKVILLDGKRFEVWENLWLALLHIRLEHTTRVLWIDAMCIDQSDVTERNHQVKQMKDIYSCAITVLVWLGLDDESSKRAFAFIDSLPEQPYAYNWISAYLVGGKYQRQWNAVLQLCRRRYWTRLWIIQEIVLAEMLVLCCGYEQLDWNKLSNIRKQITDIPTIRSTPDELVSLSQTVPIKLDQQRSHKKAGITWSLTLHNLLQAHAASCCSDPRDKVFGLLGLAIDTKLMVDYSKTLAELHADLLDELGDSVEGGPQNMIRISVDCWEIFGPSSIIDRAGDQDNAKKSYPSSKLQHVTGIYGGTIKELYMESTASTKNKIENALGWRSFPDEILAALPTNFSIQKAFARLRFNSSSPDLGNGDSPTGVQKEHPISEMNKAPTDLLHAQMLVRGYKSTDRSRDGSYWTFRATSNMLHNDQQAPDASYNWYGIACLSAREGDILCRFEDVDVVVVLRQTNDPGVFLVIGHAMIQTAGTKYPSTQVKGNTPLLRTQILPEKSFPFEIPDQGLLQSQNVIDLYLETPVIQLLTCNVRSFARPPLRVTHEVPIRDASHEELIRSGSYSLFPSPSIVVLKEANTRNERQVQGRS
jgi:hypothetical protein